MTLGGNLSLAPKVNVTGPFGSHDKAECIKQEADYEGVRVAGQAKLLDLAEADAPGLAVGAVDVAGSTDDELRGMPAHESGARR